MNIPNILNMRTWLLEQYSELVAATRFLSIVPLPGPPQRFETGEAGVQKLHLGSAYFPLVGYLLALLLALVSTLFDQVLPHLALAAVLVVTLVILTGGLHLDGLMDTCDGLFGGRTRERRLEIMRDSRVGSFGVLGGVCVLLLKFSLLTSIEPHMLPLVFFIVLPCSRWAMVCSLRLFPSARPTGLGATFRQSVTTPKFLFAALIPLLLSVLLGHEVGVLAWIAATGMAFFIGTWVTQLIGGLTGDIYGAIAECSEVVLLLLLVSMHLAV